MRIHIAAGLAGMAILSLAGCAGFSADGGFNTVAATARQRLGQDVAWARTPTEQDSVNRRVSELLQTPLSADSAVQLALLNNRGLQAAYAELAISEAELVQASRLPNPKFSMLRAGGPGPAGQEYKLEQAITVNLFALVTLPQASALERRRFERTQQAVTGDMLRLAADTRKAYYTALAAQEGVRYARQVREAAEAGAELARRMAQAGNFNALQQAREQRFHADAVLGLERAEHSAVASRERLLRLLDLGDAPASLKLPERLPDLPAQPTELPNVEQLAMDQRLDLQATRLHAEALAKDLGLTRTTRFINTLELGPARVKEGAGDAAYKTGWEVSFELPLFDWGTARVARAEAVYMQALQQSAQTAGNARSEVREAYAGYRSSYRLAAYYRDEVLPLTKRISDENLLRYNGMLIGVFDLLADARAQIASVNAALDARRDFWLAQAELDMALLGKPQLPKPQAGVAAAAAAD